MTAWIYLFIIGLHKNYIFTIIHLGSVINITGFPIPTISSGICLLFIDCIKSVHITTSRALYVYIICLLFVCVHNAASDEIFP
jgi:hypothetical protein